LIQEERQGGYSFYSLSAEKSGSPLIELTRQSVDLNGDGARLKDLLRQREDRQALNERLLEPGQSWFLWASALSSLLPRLKVADFGCGTGTLSVAVARWAERVTAIDSNPDALSEARHRAQREGVQNIEFLQEDLHKLSLRTGSQDLVVASQSLHHVSRPEEVLSEAHRILRRKGRIVVLELMTHREEWVKERLGHQHLGFEPQALKATLQRLGFEGIQEQAHARNGNTPFRVFLLTAEKS
jgi:ArsR family transcriptional regulator